MSARASVVDVLLASEPNASKYDLHFTVAKIPVRIHPMFWLVTGIFGLLGGRPSLVTVALWIAAVLASILVHELGHALVARAYGWPPKITLYGMGGVASYRPTRQTTQSQVLIAFAGPGAGFVLGAVVLAAVLLSGHAVILPGLGIPIGDGPPLMLGGGRLELFVTYLLWVNFFWGLINLAPIQPLDGGTIVSALLSRKDPSTGLVRSLKLSVGIAATLAVASLTQGYVFLVIMFAMLGFNNWQLLSQLRQPG
ncbi:MAG: hypothetical protein B7733_05655 [Myxococcales bacterium FL481]|nr:MAG: hypothetical protein B7733_05655 [Myxococcales bacterium FL481]